MQKSGGVAIPMQPSFEQLTYLVGNAETLEAMPLLPAFLPFEERILMFLQALSEKLRRYTAYSDVATFAFWCRKASMLRARETYDDLNIRLGRGVVFHIAPSNVPVNFAFSLVSGLLAGNANVVRVPSKSFPQVDLICDALQKLLVGEFTDLASYICLIRYSPNKAINDALSALCDVRVIWGGDRTIAQIRMSALKPRATEITFADRHSIAVINAEAYLTSADKARLTQDFYNDTYFSDQNACTSPRIVFWLGQDAAAARQEFWGQLHTLVEQQYSLAAVQSIGKLDALYQAAAAEVVRLMPEEDMLLTRLEVETLSGNLMDFKYHSGFFYEKEISSLDEILPVCGEQCQTLSYFGVEPEKLRTFLQTVRPRGIDRVVPIGKTMDFSLIWDGCDLIRAMSRRFSV